MTANTAFSTADFSTIDLADLDAIIGGWSWSDFSRNVGKGAVVGGATGAVAGIWTGPGVAASAGIGAAAGAVGGAVEYIGGAGGLGLW